MATVVPSSSIGGVESGNEDPARAAWGGKIEFILTCVGYAVGLGNVWRFPYLCYKNGGGAFLIPYVCMLALVGLPLFYMELCIGQFGSLGPLAVWKFAPIFKGLGYASVMVSAVIAIYYAVIIAICLLFLFKSMTSELPWTNCDNPWNTEFCRTLSQTSNSTLINSTMVFSMSSNIPAEQIKTPAEEFFYNEILRLTDNMGVAGEMRWELVGCLALVWTITCVVLIRGISSLGKVVYFTALFPYVLLTILLVRGALLEGSLEGVKYYLNPDWNKLATAQVWSDAAVQIFYSLSVASGGLVAMASYNQFNNNVLRDSLIVPVVNCATSIYAGFVIFCILGYMAQIKGVSVADVAAQGPGLTFVVYPEALTTMPLPPVWSCLFFFMMATLGFSSEFSIVECVLTAFVDEFPTLFKSSRKREIMFRIGACVICLLLGLPMCTAGGFYVLNLVDNYTSGFPLIFVGIGELAAINWVYGFKRFNEDIYLMTGRKAPMFFTVMWVGLSPALMTACLVFTAIQYQPLVFQGWAYTTEFSAIGWLVVVYCVGFIPVGAVITFCMYLYRGWKPTSQQDLCTQIKEAVTIASSPTSEWGPAKAENRVGTKYMRSGDTGYMHETKAVPAYPDMPPAYYQAATGMPDPAAGYSNGGYVNNNNADDKMIKDTPEEKQGGSTDGAYESNNVTDGDNGDFPSPPDVDTTM